MLALPANFTLKHFMLLLLLLLPGWKCCHIYPPPQRPHSLPRRFHIS
jgi:hypothetical protein